MTVYARGHSRSRPSNYISFNKIRNDKMKSLEWRWRGIWLLTCQLPISSSTIIFRHNAYCACYKEKQARNVVRYAGGPPLQWRTWLASPRDVSNYAMILSEMPKEYYWSPSPNYSPTAPHCQQSKAKENSLLGGSHENCWWHASPESLYISRAVKVHIFWEGHKILRNLHLTFDYSTYC